MEDMGKVIYEQKWVLERESTDKYLIVHFPGDIYKNVINS
jgi:hypothetical protein